MEEETKAEPEPEPEKLKEKRSSQARYDMTKRGKKSFLRWTSPFVSAINF